MSEISRSALFGRLDSTALKAIETATGFCKMRGNPYVELAHWMHILLQDPRNDVGMIRTRFAIDDAALARLHAPVGLPIGAISPGEIAVSIMADIVATRHGRALQAAEA